MIKSTKKSIRNRFYGMLSAAMLCAVMPNVAGATENSINLDEISSEESSKIISSKALLDSIPQGLVIPKMTEGVYINWANSIKYPESAKANKVQGIAIVNMVISPAGKVTAVSIFQSSGNEDIDREVIKVVSNTEGFKCGTYEGNPVATNALASFVFELDGCESKPQRKVQSPYLISELFFMARPDKKGN